MRNKLNISVLYKVEKEFGNFEIGQTFGGGNPVYLRFGYWSRVDVEKLNEKGNRTNEIEYVTAIRSLRVNSGKVQDLDRLSRKLYDLNGRSNHTTSGIDDPNLEPFHC